MRNPELLGGKKIGRGFSLEYKDIKEGKVPERLFELPVGAHKTTTTEGFDKAVGR